MTFHTRLTIEPNGGSTVFHSRCVPAAANTAGLAGIAVTMLVAVLIGVGMSRTASAENWETHGNDIDNTNSGNVGIGTDSPDEKLSIYTGEVEGALVGAATSGASTASGYKITNGNGAATYGVDSTGQVYIFSNSGKGVRFDTYVGNAMNITSDGKVGIGNSSPSALLDVAGNATFGGLLSILTGSAQGNLVSATTTGTTGSSAYYIANGNGGAAYGVDATGQAYVYSASGKGVRFDTNVGNAVNIAADGNVAIGAATPATGMKLDVEGNTAITGSLSVGTTSAPEYNRMFHLGGSGVITLDGQNYTHPFVEMRWKNSTYSRPGFLVLQNEDAPAESIGSTISHYGSTDGGTTRTQQGAYSFSWMSDDPADGAKWELWMKTGTADTDCVVIAKAVPESPMTPGRAYFRFGGGSDVETIDPMDRIHVMKGNIRLQRSDQPQSIRFFEGYTEDWAITHNVDRSLKIDSQSQRVLALNQTGGNVGVGTDAAGSKLQVAGPISTATTTKTSAYTLTDSDSVVFADATSAAVTITLPSASASTIGRIYSVIKVGSGTRTVSVAAAGGNTVNGTASTTTIWKKIEVIGYTSTSWIARVY